MNPNQMIYFNALVLQRDFQDEARRSRRAKRAAARPEQARDARAEAQGREHDLGFLARLAFPGRR